MSVEAEFRSWLQSQSLVALSSSEALAEAWGELAAIGESVSALALKEDAEEEAARQLDLFGSPIVVEVLQVAGLRVDLIAQPVNLTASRAGYASGTTVFVIAAKELDGVELTNLTVIRKLA